MMQKFPLLKPHTHIIGPEILVHYMMKFPVHVLDKIKT